MRGATLKSKGMFPSAGRRPIERRKLSHEVVDRLLERIRSGEWKPGDRLPSERDLMDHFGVGRPAVREALQSLEAMGVVEITHGERAAVKELDPRAMFDRLDRPARHLLAGSASTLEHLKEARLLFEVGMVKIAAERASAEDVARLEALVQKQEQSSGDPRAFVRADLDFHIGLAAISENPICVAVGEAMLNWLAEFHQEIVRAPGAEGVTISEHRKILAHVAERDPARAERAMRAHLKRSSKLYRLPA